MARSVGIPSASSSAATWSGSDPTAGRPICAFASASASFGVTALMPSVSLIPATCSMNEPPPEPPLTVPAAATSRVAAPPLVPAMRGGDDIMQCTICSAFVAKASPQSGQRHAPPAAAATARAGVGVEAAGGAT